jgi:hypothetical protein
LEPELESLGARPTLDNFLRAAAQWREDAASHRDGMTIAFVIGNGMAVSDRENIVFMEDFGDGLGSVLRNSISISSLIRGMAPTERRENIARNQLFFVDTGRTQTSLLADYQAPTPSAVFEATRAGFDDRTMLNMYSAAADQQAYAIPSETTLFGRALMAGLEGEAVEALPDGGWGITATSLIRAIEREFDAISAEYSVAQRPWPTTLGNVDELVISRELFVPQAVVDLKIVPEDAHPVAISVRDAQFQAVYDGAFPEDGKLKLDAGLYVVEATFEGRKEPKRQVFSVSQGPTEWVLDSAP